MNKVKEKSDNKNPLLTKDENSHDIGKNPLSIDVKTLEDAGHEDKPLVKIIRAKCIDCCGGQKGEVRKCPATNCPLWPYRMGKNPHLSHKRKAGNARVVKVKASHEGTPTLGDIEKTSQSLFDILDDKRR